MAKQRNGIHINIIEDNSRGLTEVLNEISNYSVEIGIFASDDSFYAMIANVHEFGITIKPKNASNLTIPVNPKAHGKVSADFPNIFRPKGTNVLAIPKGKNDFEVLFILVKSVTIPERSFVRSTFDEKELTWYQFLNRQVNLVVGGIITADEMFNRIGALAAADIQEKMVTLSDPPNASSTINSKGSSNPLIDTGGLRQRVTWKVVKSNA